MGFLYVKVIETKKVAIRSSFFVNYPFIRLILNGKEKKNTNFKPGVEWWDKILCFRVERVANQYIIVQARDKSIHVFGSDWLGEIRIDLNDIVEDEHVHQKWLKLGTGRKMHNRAPRGYVHVAFQYQDEIVVGRRPFAEAPVEKVCTFEEWLATQNGKNWMVDSSFFSGPNDNLTPGSNVNPSEEAQRLRQSAPAATSSTSSSGVNPTRNRSATISEAEKPRGILKKTQSQGEQLAKTRQRANSFPAPAEAKKKTTVEDDHSFSSYESEEDEHPTPREGLLIDLSFDAKPNLISSSAPVTFSNDASKTRESGFHNAYGSTPMDSAVTTSSEVDGKPAISSWYHNENLPAFSSNAHNPFSSMHNNLAPSSSVQT